MISSILITVDVEDWFQVENFKPYIPFSSWQSYELRVQKNTYRLLDILDSRKATFFILGWLAKRYPHLVREIRNRGHEVASHGYYHNLCDQQSYRELKKDMCCSKKLLEDIIGSPVIGYRAPSFSINNDILKIIEECGYLYDSSFNSFGMHGRYGKADFSGYNRKGIAFQISKNFYEIPVSNLNIRNHIIPWGGGGYFRLIPSLIFKIGVRQILKKENAYLFYMHPWEIDPSQPRVREAEIGYKFRHYVNLKRTHLKLSALFEKFNQSRFIQCQEYLKNMI